MKSQGSDLGGLGAGSSSQSGGKGLHGKRTWGRALRVEGVSRGSKGARWARKRGQGVQRPCARCAWRVWDSTEPPVPHSCLTHTIGAARASGQQACGDRPSVNTAWGGQAVSPSTLTVNRPLVRLRLPMKNRAPCTDRAAGKGTSAVLKTVGGGLAVGE